MSESVTLSPRAKLQLAVVIDYLISRNPAAADRLMARFEIAFQQLADFPSSGTRDRAPNIRRLVMAPYVLLYRVRPAGVEIVDIRHGRQREAPPPDELP